MNLRSLALAVAATAAIAGTGPLVTGCAPLVVGAIGTGALVAADRRSTGAVVDDEGIELKVRNASLRYGSDLHLSVTSYNGVVLLSGEAPSQDVINDLVNFARTTARVRKVENEMTVGPVASLGSRSNDTLITSKVKARFVEANRFAPVHVKVVTERGVVYLFGLVSRDEAQAATEIAAATSGVQRVVRLFEYV